MATDTQISKTLSYWLRHKPDAASLTLTSDGWADVDQVLGALSREHLPADWERLLQIVETNDKSRFELSSDASRIRARQGHSIDVVGAWTRMDPPDELYHGTVERFMDAIQSEGLRRMSRHHVHLSAAIDDARRVGARRGKPIVLCVEASRLAATGVEFFVTTNGVWLVDSVAPEYLRRL